MKSGYYEDKAMEIFIIIVIFICLYLYVIERIATFSQKHVMTNASRGVRGTLVKFGHRGRVGNLNLIILHTEHLKRL